MGLGRLGIEGRVRFCYADMTRKVDQSWHLDKLRNDCDQYIEIVNRLNIMSQTKTLEPERYTNAHILRPQTTAPNESQFQRPSHP